MTGKNYKLAHEPDVSMARQSLYRFCSLTLLDPKFGCSDQLAALREETMLCSAAELIRSLPEAVADRLAPGEQLLKYLTPQRVFACLPNSADALNDEFEKTFGLLVSNACPPYETEYIDGKLSFQRSNALADVSGFYHAFEVTTASRHPERPDHIVLELEFMAYLIGLERRAGDEPTASDRRREVCRSAQNRFLREHLSWWAPAFAKLLSREAQGGFYAAAGALLGALVAAERALLGVAPAERKARPSSVERPEACDGCALVS